MVSLTIRSMLLALVAGFGLTACGGLSLPSLPIPFMGEDESQPPEYVVSGPTVGQLVDGLPQLELEDAEPIKPTRDEVMAAYNRVYGSLASMQANQAVGKRLADLHMQVGEEQDIDGLADPYAPAIDLYESLLNDPDSLEQADEVLYQLARAHDLAGNSEQALNYLHRLVDTYPNSEFTPEARFRRAEIRFSAEDYRAAAQDYGFVVSLGDATPYYRNATYMLGWTEFKRSRFEEGLDNFYTVIDHLLADSTDGEDLDSINTELLNDSFRVVTLALAYLDGPLTLADTMRVRGKPHWQFLAYERLAADYFDKGRFLDSVQTWQTFVEHNTLDARAPGAHIGMIETLVNAGFPSDVLPKKEEFVLRYGIYSEFWQVHPEEVRQAYLPTLHEYLTELAKLAHADAQKPLDAKGKPLQLAEPERRSRFLDAAQWYEQIVETFPEDPRTAEYLFLLGESYTEAAEPGRAVAAYQRVLREFPDFEQAHEAGYAAILGLEDLVASASPDELELWQRLKIDAQIEFALLFPGDERAPAVQADAADSLFQLGFINEAVQLAENLLLEWPDVAQPLQTTALLIVGHGRFEQEQFAAAETAYRQLMGLTLETADADKVTERLLAAIYKQGEAAEAEGLVDQAVGHYLRIADVSAVAPLAAQGQFDAVAVLEGAGRVSEASELLADFRSRYPDHELAAGIDLRLASMYEQTENWSSAAAEYVTLSRGAEDEAVRRQSLYRAAEIYREQNQAELAIEHFRNYAHTYKQPVDLRLEAMHNMDELYQQTGDADKRRFWLKQKIDLHRGMGSGATERATFLAASAQAVFAEEAKAEFASIALKHPLKRSLKRKQKALQKTLRAYEALASYEVAQFTTASTFEIASLYRTLSAAIMDSDRPGNLSELEMAQYEILLEEQAFPFEEQAIDLHQINMQRAWSGVYDDWVKQSFEALAQLMPGRFAKTETEVRYATAIH